MDTEIEMKIILCLISHGSTDEVEKAIKSLNISIEKYRDKIKNKLSVLIIENKDSHDVEIHKVKLKNNILSDVYNLNILQIKNKGYSNAINCALNYARNKLSGFLIVGNPDIEFTEDYIDKLCNYLSRDKTFSVAVPSVLNNGINQNPRVEIKIQRNTILMLDLYFSSYLIGYLINYLKYLKSKIIKRPNTNDTKDLSKILIPCGVQYIFNIKNIPNSLNLDEKIFLWGEELMLSYKLKEMGLHQIYFKDLVISHDQSTTVSLLGQYNYYKIAKKSYKYIRKYYFLLNQ